MKSLLPSISVVIPTYNGRALLEKHLPDVFSVLQRGDEVIVVDDASTDATVAWCKEMALSAERDFGIVLIVTSHAQNKRFAAAVNTGVSMARHPYVFLLNNDVSPITANIKALLLSHFESDATLFAVGCAEITSLEKNAALTGRGTGDFRRGLLVHWFDTNQNSPNTLWTSGGSMLFDRQKFEALGGMDTLFYPAYEEDRDLSYRAVKHGWSLRFEPKAVVLHQHESTNSSVFGRRRMEEMSWKNQYLLVWKNITDTSLLHQHLLWLPYHLTISSFRTKGVAFNGFLRAIGQLTEALRQRETVKKLWQRSDKEVLNIAQGSVSE